MIRLYGIITLAMCFLFGVVVIAAAVVGSWLPRPDYDSQIEYETRPTVDRQFTNNYRIDRLYGVSVILARMPGMVNTLGSRIAEDVNGGAVLTLCAATCDLWQDTQEFARPITDTPDVSEMYPTWNRLNTSLAFAACDPNTRICEMMLWDGVTIQNLTNTPNLTEDFPVWSSDGRLAFDACDVNYICDVMVWDGAALHNLTNTPNLSESFERWNNEGEIGICRPACSSLAYMDGADLMWLSDVPPVQAAP